MKSKSKLQTAIIAASAICIHSTPPIENAPSFTYQQKTRKRGKKGKRAKDWHK